jgi:SAM-dependent methyltransferase
MRGLLNVAGTTLRYTIGMNFEKPKVQEAPKPLQIDREDEKEAFRKLLAALEQTSVSVFRNPDDTISPEQECTPNEIAARRDFESINAAMSELGIDLQTKRVLEIGSGMGELLRMLRKEGVHAVGIDFNPRDFGHPRGEERIINAPLGALKPDKTGLFGVVLAKNVFDNDRYKFQVYKDMLADIGSLLEEGGVFLKLGTGDFVANDLPENLQKISGSTDFEIYRKNESS